MTNNLPPTRNDKRQHRAPQVTQHQEPTGAHQPTQYHIERVRRQRKEQQRENPFFFPLWSLILMLVMTMLTAFVIVFFFVTLGGNSSVPQQDAEIRVVTQSPSLTPNIPDPNEIILATATLPAELQVVLPAETPVNLSLDGPVLPTVAITTTPVPISIGVRVVVVEVGDQELNVRNIPGVTESQIIFRSPEGTEFSIVDGPQQADGFTWWQIQDLTSAQRGWAVANYLSVISAEAG
jgi:hypothetical protein